MNKTIVICNIEIRQDGAGRYCLNDMHRAAGGKRKQGPALWMSNLQTKELIAEIAQDLSDTGIPVSVIKGGTQQGTYVCDDLVYAYAMWISPKFCLRVIRAYKQQTGQDLQESIGLIHLRLALETKDAASKVRASFGSHLMLDRRRALPAIKSERAKLESAMQGALFALTSPKLISISQGSAQ